MTGQSLGGRIAIVTGGESGIGAGCVAALAAAGADVAIVYHSDAGQAATSAAAVSALGRKAVTVQADVGDEHDVEAAFDLVAHQLGIPDILVNSAGINMSGTEVMAMELAQWERMLRTDLTGSFLTSRRFVRNLASPARTGATTGAIINITSIHSSVMRAGGADYDAAKGGQQNLTKTMALETARLGITVNAIAPGMIPTPMNERAMTDAVYRQSLTHSIPLGRAGTPNDVAGVAVFLASAAGAYITGATIVIDGGLSLQLGQGA